MNLKTDWWKWLCIILLSYTLVRGVLTPLKPGIRDVRPSSFKSGEDAQMDVIGYNSHYLQTTEQTRVYLKISDSFLIQSAKVTATTETNLQVTFKLPEYLPVRQTIASASLIVDNPNDGASIIPGKIILKQDSIQFELGKQLWTPTEKVKFHYKSNYLFPYRNILYETIRNTFFHVSLWFAMFLLFGLSVWYSIKYLKTNHQEFDLKTNALVRVGILFGILGCITGSLWAKYTWDTWWTRDIKLNMALITMLIYFAYIILRSSVEDSDRRARISSAYNIFALVATIPLIFILPRLTDSLHPGNGGNPAIGAEDMDNSLRVVFYPAVLGFMLLGLWMASLLYRIDNLQVILDEKENIS
ncbi:MAG: cytochrome c biogenesis protein [Bacteroidota bacterium]|nr:cytochrome c biogenesis protein [Bacteroidota bacterium]